MEFKAKELLVVVAVKNNGDWDKEYRYIKDRQNPTREEIEKFSPLSEQAVTILDEDYPDTWKHVYKPPMILFYKGGERSLLSKIGMSSISILDDGKDPQTKKIIDDILEEGGLIAIPELNSGDIVIKDKTQSLILSEYPYDAYNANSEEQRARVINVSIGLCGKFFIGIVKNASVIDTAVSYALSNENDVYVVPTSLGTKYVNNRLIREGANIALDWRDVISDDDDDDDEDDDDN